MEIHVLDSVYGFRGRIWRQTADYAFESRIKMRNRNVHCIIA